MAAARRGYSHIVIDLIEAGADLDILDDYNHAYGGTALILAVRNGVYPQCTRPGRTMKECQLAATCLHVCKFAKGEGPGEKQETRYFDTVQVKRRSISSSDRLSVDEIFNL